MHNPRVRHAAATIALALALTGCAIPKTGGSEPIRPATTNTATPTAVASTAPAPTTTAPTEPPTPTRTLTLPPTPPATLPDTLTWIPVPRTAYRFATPKSWEYLTPYTLTDLTGKRNPDLVKRMASRMSLTQSEFLSAMQGTEAILMDPVTEGPFPPNITIAYGQTDTTYTQLEAIEMIARSNADPGRIDEHVETFVGTAVRAEYTITVQGHALHAEYFIVNTTDKPPLIFTVSSSDRSLTQRVTDNIAASLSRAPIR